MSRRAQSAQRHYARTKAAQDLPRAQAAGRRPQRIAAAAAQGAPAPRGQALDGAAEPPRPPPARGPAGNWTAALAQTPAPKSDAAAAVWGSVTAHPRQTGAPAAALAATPPRATSPHAACRCAPVHAAPTASDPARHAPGALARECVLTASGPAQQSATAAADRATAAARSLRPPAAQDARRSAQARSAAHRQDARGARAAGAAGAGARGRAEHAAERLDARRVAHWAQARARSAAPRVAGAAGARPWSGVLLAPARQILQAAQKALDRAPQGACAPDPLPGAVRAPGATAVAWASVGRLSLHRRR